MENRTMVGASFVTYLAGPGWNSELKVSKEFVKKYAEILQPTIELRREGEPGKLWKVKTELAGERCFLTEGWSSFVQEAGIEHQEILVFTFVGESVFQSVFDVSVYDATGCKKFPSHEDEAEDVGSSSSPEIIPVVVISDDEHEQEHERVIILATPENLTFTKVVRDHHYYCSRMDIPKKFVLATGIIATMQISLVDWEGRSWPVKITDRRGRQMFNMSAGFIDFLNANGVPVGTTISFQFIRPDDNTVEARITPYSQPRRRPRTRRRRQTTRLP